MKKRTLNCGIIAAVLLFLGLFISISRGIGFPLSQLVTVILSFLLIQLSFGFALFGIIKPQKSISGIILCSVAILGFVITYMMPMVIGIRELILDHIQDRSYSEDYFLDSNKNKIHFTLGEGNFLYGTTDYYPYDGIDKKYYFGVYNIDPDDEEYNKYTYCNWLFPENQNPMVGIESYYGCVEFEKANRQTKVYSGGSKCLVLPWGKNYAIWEKSKEKIPLKQPNIHREYNGKAETFVDTDVLYYIQALSLFDSGIYCDFIDFLLEKDMFICKNGTKKGGEWYYKNNVISGAATYFNNNELLEDSVIKIGTKIDELVSYMGPGHYYTTRENKTIEYSKTMVVGRFDEKLRATGLLFTYNDKDEITEIRFYCEPID